MPNWYNVRLWPPVNHYAFYTHEEIKIYSSAGSMFLYTLNMRHYVIHLLFPFLPWHRLLNV
jgi:hypothetical protein